MDGTLGCREFSDDEELKNSKDIKKFLWKVARLSYWRCRLENVATGRIVVLNQTEAGLAEKEEDATNFYISTYSDGYCLYYYPPSSYDYYSLTFDSSSATCLGTSNKYKDKKYKWILRQATGDGSIPGAEKEITRERRQIKIVNKYGDAWLLQQIKRNEHVTVSINIFYNRELGEFDFKVSSWKEVSNETTFD